MWKIQIFTRNLLLADDAFSGKLLPAEAMGSGPNTGCDAYESRGVRTAFGNNPVYRSARHHLSHRFGFFFFLTQRGGIQKKKFRAP